MPDSGCEDFRSTKVPVSLGKLGDSWVSLKAHLEGKEVLLILLLFILQLIQFVTERLAVLLLLKLPLYYMYMAYKSESYKDYF